MSEQEVPVEEHPWQVRDRLRKAMIAMSSDEFDQMMCKRFPGIFADRNKPMSETCMCWGFDVGSGWYPILFDLCEKIDVLCRLSGVKVIADQVKEKYATLRFYFHTLPPTDITPEDRISPADAGIIDDIVHDLVDRAGSVTGQTCEKCGDYGSCRIFGFWHITLCDAHTEEMAIERGQPVFGAVEKEEPKATPEAPTEGGVKSSDGQGVS